MSQMSGVVGDGFAVQTPKAVSSGRAVLLLALAVVLGVVLLHELDNSSAVQTTAPAKEAAPAPNPAPNPAPAAAPVRAPSEVKVMVANGTTVNGAANKVAGRLQPIGYQLAKPGNTTAPATASAVQYAPGYQPEAQALATSLGIPSSAVQQMPFPAPIADLQGANVMVIVGNELAGQANTNQGATGNQNPANNAQSAQNPNPALNGPLNANTANKQPNAQTPANPQQQVR